MNQRAGQYGEKEVLGTWLGAVIVNGFLGLNRIECCIINVYSPCVLSEKEELWDRLSTIISYNSYSCVCVAGDFNSIRRTAEREGISGCYNYMDMISFDLFIPNSGMIDLPLHGRTFTWYKPNGSCKIRIDRILVNSGWISEWPNTHQRGMKRSISDHCPILL
ncbi:hypothetical protein ACS0TY_033233 [Phlomoides rotata]